MPKPEQGKVVVVAALPTCDFCAYNGEAGVPAMYDFATSMGPWGNGCERHYRMFRVSPNLGVGVAQLLITPDQVEET